MTEPRHEPATCDQPAETCEHCDGYNIGYTVGKEKARREIIYRLGEAHLNSCGCDLCNVLRAVIDAFIGRQTLWRAPSVSSEAPEDNIDFPPAAGNGPARLGSDY